MRTILAGIVFCSLLGIQVLTAAAQADPASELLQRVNEYRVANGASVLEVNSALMSAAQRQANWLAANHRPFASRRRG